MNNTEILRDFCRFVRDEYDKWAPCAKDDDGTPWNLTNSIDYFVKRKYTTTEYYRDWISYWISDYQGYLGGKNVLLGDLDWLWLKNQKEVLANRLMKMVERRKVGK